MLEKAKTYKQPRLFGLALNTAIRLQTNSLTRKERESMLDKISGSFEDKTTHDTPGKDYSVTTGTELETDAIDSMLLRELSAMTRLMNQRNPTSQLVSSHTIFLSQSLTIDSVPMRLTSGVLPVLAIGKLLKANLQRPYC